MDWREREEAHEQLAQLAWRITNLSGLRKIAEPSATDIFPELNSWRERRVMKIKTLRAVKKMKYELIMAKLK